MVSATRLTSCRTPVSRCGVPRWPCRYFEATMLVAVIDQSMGTSTSFCSKMLFPLVSVIEAVRFSHWSSSYGETPSFEKRRVKVNPPGVAGGWRAAVGTWGRTSFLGFPISSALVIVPPWWLESAGAGRATLREKNEDRDLKNATGISIVWAVRVWVERLNQFTVR